MWARVRRSGSDSCCGCDSGAEQRLISSEEDPEFQAGTRVLPPRLVPSGRPATFSGTAFDPV